MTIRRFISFVTILIFAVIVRASDHANSALDTPLFVGSDPGVAGAITTAGTALNEEDSVFFGEAVNALREEFLCYASEKLTKVDFKRFEITLLDGMTPRKIILAGLPLYRRQNHSPEAGKGLHQDWAAKNRMPDKQIEDALVHYANKG